VMGSNFVVCVCCVVTIQIERVNGLLTLRILFLSFAYVEEERTKDLFLDVFFSCRSHTWKRSEQRTFFLSIPPILLRVRTVPVCMDHKQKPPK
jgi:hypothetical protein